MSLIAAGDTTEENAAPVINHPFFPSLEIAAFREAMRVDNTITAARATHALEAAMYEANARLSTWALERLAEGRDTVDDVPPRFGHPAGAPARLYLRAIWCLAKAQLTERYRDYDSTRAGLDRGDQVEETADDYRRDAAWAINDLTGMARSTVELI